MEVLHEIYFGKQSGLLKLEDLFTKLRAKYNRAEVLSNIVTYRELVKDPINKTIGETISNLFGFVETMFTYANDKKYNAYTVPFPIDDKGNIYDAKEKPLLNKDIDKAIIVTNRGIRFDQRVFKTNFLVCINTGLFFSNILTVSEIIAALLHEIGHTFTKTMIDLKILNDRMDERFADQFVAMYGYGPEYVKSMDIFTTPRYGNIEEKFTNVPIVNLFIGIKKIWKQFSIRSTGTDEHPNIISRQQSQIQQLESDLKNTPNLSPTMRKELQKQLDQCKELMNNSFKYGDDNGSNSVVRYYYKEWEPNFSKEQKQQKYSDKYVSPDTINARLNKLYKRKGKKK